MRAVFLFLLGLVACVSPESRRDVGGTVIRTGSVELTIGGADETREEYLFGRVSSLELLETGRILVLDQSTSSIRAFGPDGRFLFTIGRRGSGPGELNWPCCLAIARDGSLWVREIANRRYSQFALGDTGATFVRSVRQAVANPRPTPYRTAWDDGGRLVDLGHIDSGYVRAFLDSTGMATRWDSIPSAPSDSLAMMRIRRTEAGGMAIYYYPQPHGPVELRAFGPGGMVAEAVSSNYDVTWFAADRSRIAQIHRDVAGPELSPRERQEADSTLDAIATENHTSRSALDFGVPSRKAVVRHLVFDVDGRLWIERSVPDGEAREADVYDRSGALVAVMRWPANVSLVNGAIRGDDAIGVSHDGDGTPSIVRLRFR